MTTASRPQSPFRASSNEQASIRALKNWLLSAPPENALEDQIVRQRLSAAIASVTVKSDERGPKPTIVRTSSETRD